jgi:hypothetical protein
MDIMELGASDELTQKWAPALDGIDNDYTKRVTAQLLENQLKSAQQDRVDESGAYGAGTTTVGSIGTFQKFAFPLVRRVFPELIANNLVSVQPMSAPVSQVFYLGSARVYGKERQNLYSKYQLTYRGKVTGEPQFKGIGASSLTQLITSSTQEAFGGSALSQEPATAGEANMASAIALWPNSTFAQGWSVSAGERLAGSAIPEVTMSIEQQPVIARTKKMRALWTLEASQDLKAYHNLDLERELTDLLGKEIRLEVDRELIENLRGLAYDLTGNHGSLYRKGMLDQATNTPVSNFDPATDSSFGDFLFAPDGAGDADAVTSPRSVADIPGIPGSYQVGRNTFLFDFNNTALSDFAPRHIGDKYANLLAVINLASQDIYKTTQRGAGNWIICAPVMATLLETAARLTGGIESSDAPTNFGPGTIQFRGKFMGRYDLYVDPLYPEGELMMGYKGSSPMDGGFIYAPYIPFQALPTITDPESFQPRKGILTRYGKVAVAPASRFYRVIRMIGSEGITAGIDQRLPIA